MPSPHWSAISILKCYLHIDSNSIFSVLEACFSPSLNLVYQPLTMPCSLNVFPFLHLSLKHTFNKELYLFTWPTFFVVVSAVVYPKAELSTLDFSSNYLNCLTLISVFTAILFVILCLFLSSSTLIFFLLICITTFWKLQFYLHIVYSLSMFLHHILL